MMTLTYSGTERALADWGFDQDSAEMLQVSQGMDVFTLSMPGVSIYADPIIPFEGQVIIRSGRTGSGTTWSGGTIEFQGKRLMAVLDGRPEYEGVLYQFGGPWYDIDQTPYQQTVYYWTGPGTTTGSYLVSDLVLFQKVTAPGVTAYRNTGQQIQDILQHVLDQYSAQSLPAPFQFGTFAVASSLPTYQVKDIKCSEAIQICLRPSPDAVVKFDYTTTPPTVSVLKQSGMSISTLAVADGVQHESIKLIPRYDLQVRSVVLYFKQSNSVNGDVYVQTTKQVYPTTVGTPEGGLRVLVQTIDLAGFSADTVNGTLKCDAVANTQAWWGKYIPELASSRIASFSVGPMTIKDDDTGATLSLGTYPNVLLDGQVAPWMSSGGTPIVSKRAVITASASYVQNDAWGRSEQVFSGRLLQARVQLTNGTTGSYASLSSAVAGEPIPTSMAQDIYTALSTLQYEGEITVVQRECAVNAGVGTVLNLTGGRTEWTTMAAIIQTVRRQFGIGKTTITIGPARHLSAADLTQLFLINRFRRVYVNPAMQATAQMSATGTVTVGANVAKENTGAGLEERNLLALSAVISGGPNAAQIRHDAGSQSLLIAKLDSTLTQLASTSSVSIKCADLEPDGTHRNAKFELVVIKDATDCTLKQAYFMKTPWETPP